MPSIPEAQVGMPVTTQVYELTSETLRNLSDYAHETRPLVVCFGSYTCPTFLRAQDDFRSLVKDCSVSADFLLVYIKEAKPKEESPASSIPAHACIEDRVAAAEVLRGNGYQCTIVCDPMDDQNSQTFNTGTCRFVILVKDILMHAFRIGPKGFNIDEVRSYLKRFAQDIMF